MSTLAGHALEDGCVECGHLWRILTLEQILRKFAGLKHAARAEHGAPRIRLRARARR